MLTQQHLDADPDRDRQPPHDLAAEQAVLGAMLLSTDALTDCLDLVGPGDFYRPAHGTIFATLADLHAHDQPADPITVAAELLRRGELLRLGGAPYLHTLLAAMPTAANATYYAEIVADKALCRRLIAAGTRIAQLGYHADAARGLDGASDAVATRAFDALSEALTGRGAADSDPPISLGQLLAEVEEPHDWLVPDLLERQDRLIVTGFEGTGKSVYIAQMALCVAGGLHPLTGRPLPGLDGGTRRVLVFDVENSRRQVRRRYAAMSTRVDALRARAGLDPVDWFSAVRLELRPEGVDLTDNRELTRLERASASTAPDLIVGGPLYKMSPTALSDEEGAMGLLSILDRLRVRHDCALILEAHAGHAQDGGGNRRVRPIGPSVYLRWSEFGFGLRAHPDHLHEEHPTRVVVQHWRGSRDERAWPPELVHGSSRELPWSVTPAYYAMLDQRGHA